MSLGFKLSSRACASLFVSLMALLASGNGRTAEGPMAGRAQEVPGVIRAALRPSGVGPGVGERADGRREVATDPSLAEPADGLGIAAPPTLTFRGHSDGVWGLTYSGDGQRLATAGFDGTARVWEAGTGRE
ncbi:MAG: hypothetical protein ACREXU_14925, partial [Gammaproteobacteria bacterium]